MIRTVDLTTGQVTDGGNAPSLPPLESPQVTVLTFAQLIIGLVTEGWITEAEGDAWLDGNLPQPVLDLIDEMPAGQRFAVKAKAKRFVTADLNDPIVLALADVQNKTPEQLAQFYNTYGAL